MTHVTCRLTAKNRDQLRNPTFGNQVWATVFYLIALKFSLPQCLAKNKKTAAKVGADQIHSGSRDLQSWRGRGSHRVIASTHELQCEQSHWNPVELKNESTRVLNSSPVRLSSCAITNSHELKVNSIQEQFPQQVYIFLYFVFCVLCSASVVFVFFNY